MESNFFLFVCSQEVPTASIKKVLEMTEKTKTERASTEFRRSGKDVSSKFFTPIQQNVMSPTHK